jgi:hypothetical protein
MATEWVTSGQNRSIQRSNVLIGAHTHAGAMPACGRHALPRAQGRMMRCGAVKGLPKLHAPGRVSAGYTGHVAS